MSKPTLIDRILKETNRRLRWKNLEPRTAPVEQIIEAALQPIHNELDRMKALDLLEGTEPLTEENFRQLATLIAADLNRTFRKELDLHAHLRAMPLNVLHLIEIRNSSFGFGIVVGAEVRFKEGLLEEDWGWTVNDKGIAAFKVPAKKGSGKPSMVTEIDLNAQE